jgi:hypothetical protein
MCLACELDALWYAEWERLAAEGANTAGPPGTADGQVGAGGGSGLPQSEIREWVEGAAGETPAVLAAGGGAPAVADSETPAVPMKPAAPRSRFSCEEAE